MGNRTKVFQDSISRPRSRHNVTNPDKLKLVNYNRKIYNTEIFQVQNFVFSMEYSYIAIVVL